MTVRIPIDVSATGVENVKKIKEEITKLKGDIDEIQSKGGFKEEEKIETADNKKIIEAFEKEDFKELTDLEAKVAERVLEKLKGDIDEIQSKGGFKEEEKIETADNKKIIEAFEKEDFKELTDLEAKVAERVLEKLKGEGISNTSEVTKKDFNKIVNKSKKEVEDKRSKTKKEVEDKRSKIDKTLEQDLGFNKAQNILNYGTNPSGAILQQLLKTGALPAALIGAPVVAAKVIEFLQQEGNLLDRFFDDRIDNRTDALRDKDKLQRILQGFDSIRISTIDGNSDPRNIYNSFEVFENDRKLLEAQFRIRTNIK